MCMELDMEGEEELEARPPDDHVHYWLQPGCPKYGETLDHAVGTGHTPGRYLQEETDMATTKKQQDGAFAEALPALRAKVEADLSQHWKVVKKLQEETDMSDENKAGSFGGFPLTSYPEEMQGMWARLGLQSSVLGAVIPHYLQDATSSVIVRLLLVGMENYRCENLCTTGLGRDDVYMASSENGSIQRWTDYWSLPEPESPDVAPQAKTYSIHAPAALVQQIERAGDYLRETRGTFATHVELSTSQVLKSLINVGLRELDRQRLEY